tara:strand:- start:263 stop:544 length:282 start_codon:yes stop_codon:yes gene_type:complete
MAEEELIEEGASGEEFLRREDVQAAFEEEPEVVELPPNIQRMQGKIENLRQEIGNLETQFAQVQDALDTRVAALSWYSEQVMKHFEVTAAKDD